MIGIINIYKEKGYTSHDVVAIMRRLAGTKKVGHTGTLDPDATGVLPICIGRATKLADHLASADKTYIAEVILGVETDTGDISGEVIAEKPVSFDKDAIIGAVNSFAFEVRGEYLQTPPMYSAIKIGGRKLYELARKGETIERPPRPVVIHSIQVIGFSPEKNSFTIEVSCSKGTYIRSLAMDIGKMLGCGATMGELERTQSGIFTKADSYKLDNVKEATETGEFEKLLMPVEKLLPYPKLYVSGHDLTLAKNGNPLFLPTPKGKYWLCDNDETIGLFVSDSKKLRAEVML